MLAHAEAPPELSGSVSSTSGACSATAAWAEVERADEEHAWRRGEEEEDDDEDVAGRCCCVEKNKKSSTTAAEEPFFRFRGRVDEDGFGSRFMPTGRKLKRL